MAYNPFTNSLAYDCGDNDIILERMPTSDKTYRYIHTVLPGETLQSIAFKYYGISGAWGEIADLNSIYNALDLEPGTQILIP